MLNDSRLPMSRTKFFPYFSLLLFLPLLLLAARQGLAASPWHWALTLRQQTVGDPIIHPTDLYIDPKKQQYYVVDSGRNRLISFDRKGTMLHILNAGKALKTPYALTRTGPTGLWISEKGKNSLTHVDLQEKKVTEHTLQDRGQPIYPDRLEAGDGTIFVLDKGSGDIVSLAPESLEIKTRFSCTECAWGFVDFLLHGGRIWALDQDGGTVQKFSFNGTREKVIRLQGGDLVNPVSLTIGPSGYLYILDRHRREIMVFDDQGTFKYRFLRKGIAQGQLHYPIKIRFDPWGRLCVVDEGNARVEIFRR